MWIFWRWFVSLDVSAFWVVLHCLEVLLRYYSRWLGPLGAITFTSWGCQGWWCCCTGARLSWDSFFIFPQTSWQTQSKSRHISKFKSQLVTCNRAKGSHPVRKVQFFWTLFKRPLTPPFYLNICPILQGVFFKTRFCREWKFDIMYLFYPQISPSMPQKSLFMQISCC